MTNVLSVSKTLGGAAERINVGSKSPEVQETTSSVYHVVSGTGYSIINGEKIEWKQSDTFCIPTWAKYQQFNTGAENVYLYRVDDKPMITALGFYRRSDMDIEALVSA